MAVLHAGAITSDAGDLLLRYVDRPLGLIDRVADCFADHRNPDRIQHSVRGRRTSGRGIATVRQKRPQIAPRDTQNDSGPCLCLPLQRSPLTNPASKASVAPPTAQLPYAERNAG